MPDLLGGHAHACGVRVRVRVRVQNSALSQRKTHPGVRPKLFEMRKALVPHRPVRVEDDARICELGPSRLAHFASARRKSLIVRPDAQLEACAGHGRTY